MLGENKKLQVYFFVVSVSKFYTKIWEAFVKERKVSFLLMVKNPVRNVCKDYKLKTVQNKFFRKLVSKKLVFECNVCNMELYSQFSELAHMQETSVR